MRSLSLIFCLPVLLGGQAAQADGPADNIAAKVRPVPPPGVAIPDVIQEELTAVAAKFKESIDGSAAAWEHFPERAKYLPDVEIFWKAADWALRYGEFYDVKQTDWARDQLKEGQARLAALTKDEKPWLAQTGLVPRGYRSKIDRSVQPFGMVVPPSFNPSLPYRWRLDCWFHGRGEKLTELDFIHQRQTQAGEFTPPDTLVLHPYGRFCNGQRFAGETDFFEALDTVKRDYRVDEDRIIVRGFSLGGAACWHIATHHASQWCAANPGAGFSETEEFLNFFQGETLKPFPWERQMWNLYDATVVAPNLFNCPTVAYSGEIDKQKQAADRMESLVGANGTGFRLRHIVGSKTGHKYEPGAKAEVSQIIDQLAQAGRRAVPRSLQLNLSTLKYNKMAWLTVDALDAHWAQARIEAAFDSGFKVKESGVSAFSLSFPSGTLPEELSTYFAVSVTEWTDDDNVKPQFPYDGEVYTPSDRSLNLSFARISDGKWGWAKDKLPSGLRKKHNLQGPVDDAFMDSFIFVRPTGNPANEKARAWSAAELDRAIREWRRQYRGDAQVKDDTQITDADIKSSNLILWGDPSSNSFLAKVAPKLPVSWTAGEIKAGVQTFSAADHALICIYPNPFNPDRYVVLNSSFTFREYDYLNNARQTPKLPDWAVVDLKTPPDSRYPGAIPAAGFFGEKWEFKEPASK